MNDQCKVQSCLLDNMWLPPCRWSRVCSPCAPTAHSCLCAVCRDSPYCSKDLPVTSQPTVPQSTRLLSWLDRRARSVLVGSRSSSDEGARRCSTRDLQASSTVTGVPYTRCQASLRSRLHQLSHSRADRRNFTNRCFIHLH